jgi:uncharacterized protein YgbK (DUF1537 family)
MAVLQALGAASADLVAQVEPGIPALVLRGGTCPDLPFVTKAGGFGTVESLLNAVRWLQGHSP